VQDATIPHQRATLRGGHDLAKGRHPILMGHDGSLLERERHPLF
jgi:hypothetical protein